MNPRSIPWPARRGPSDLLGADEDYNIRTIRIGRRQEVVVVVERQGRRVVSASLSLVRWMHGHVPRHQLSPEQVALVEWFDEYNKSDREIGTVIG